MRGRRRNFAFSLMRFRRAKDGAAAVEFAMLAFPFFLIIAGMAEVTMLGFAQAGLDYAVGETGRRIRTGQIQDEKRTAADVRSEICNNLTWLLSIDCPGMLRLDVDTYASYQAISTATPNYNQPLPFDPGGPSSIVMIRAYIEMPMMTPIVSQFLADLPDNKRLISSTMLFRNEPFPAPTP